MQAHIATLPHRAVIRITGPDWAPFLKGLYTAHLDEMLHESASGGPFRLHYGAFLRPQGKMYADALLRLAAPDDVHIDVPAKARAELLAKLNMYRLRAKVEISTVDAQVSVALGAIPEGFLPDPRSAITGGTFGMAYGPQQATTDANAWADFRYAHGFADMGPDFAADELYAIDANLDLLGAIDFHKGCYVGQELTSRMKRRGQIKNRILGLKHDSRLAMGAEILSGDRRAGEVLASGDGVSLGLMRLDRLDGMLTVDGAPVQLNVAGWIAPHAST